MEPHDYIGFALLLLMTTFLGLLVFHEYRMDWEEMFPPRETSAQIVQQGLHEMELTYTKSCENQDRWFCSI